MKKLILTLSLLLLVTGAYAQRPADSRNTLRVGVNGAFFSWGDTIGHTFNLEYSYSLNKYVALTPMFISGYYQTHSSTNYNFSNLNMFGCGLSVRITPFPRACRWLKVEVGGLYQNYTHVYGVENDIYTYGPAGNRPSADWYRQECFGLVGSLAANILETERLELGVRGSLFTGIYSGTINSEGIHFGAYFGVKF